MFQQGLQWLKEHASDIQPDQGKSVKLARWWILFPSKEDFKKNVFGTSNANALSSCEGLFLNPF